MKYPQWFYDRMLELLGWPVKARDEVAFDATVAALWADVVAHVDAVNTAAQQR